MLQLPRPLVATLALAGLTLAVPATLRARTAPQAPSPRHTEPPMQLRIEGLGDAFEALEGQDVRVQLDGKELTLRVTSLGRRVLDTGHVSFAYPTMMAFEFDPTEGSDTWTLDGGSTTLILDVHPDPVPVTLMTEKVRSVQAEMFERNPQPIEPLVLTLGEREVRSDAIRIDFQGLRLRTHVLALDEEDGEATHFLTFQEVTEKGEEVTEEFRQVVELFEETFQRGN